MEIPPQQLIELAMGALETTAFMITDPLDATGEVRDPMVSTIRIESPEVCTRLLLEASHGFLAELASSMLGMEPEEISSEEGGQALMELANILGGEIVMALGGQENAQLILGLPEVPGDEELATFSSSSTRVGLESFGETLNITLVQE